MLRFMLILGIFLASLGTAAAATFYVDPINGSAEGDGSHQTPWRTFQEVVDSNLIESETWNTFPWYEATGRVIRNEGAPIKAGDEIILMSGYHGEVLIQAYLNTDTITVKAGALQTPCFGNINVRASERWRFQGISISPSYAPEYTTTRLFYIETHNWRGPSSYITLEDSNLFSVEDASAWTAQDWLDRAPSAISVSGDYCEIRNNRLVNINFGISVSGDHCVVAKNRIINFSGDAMRGLGDYGLFENNFVANAFDVNENHDDGFQSWATDEATGEVKGVVLRGNKFFHDFNHPNPALISTFQGIGLFDGFYTDWIIENNLVVVNHWHGISMYGARNCRIQNNTVADIYDGRPGPAWIMVTTHKDGTGGYGNVVRNNLAHSISINADSGTPTVDSNLILDDLEAVIADPYGNDFHLRAGSPAIDAGTNIGLAHTDIEGNPRVIGSIVDLGAYEYSPLPTKVDQVMFLLY
ncbi:hypothetical protein JXA32_01880 [Candidatus Sumerlaeota bacterium]|nr:hypothetical protein [Candidatus Sumerlaeota bacterium]